MGLGLACSSRIEFSQTAAAHDGGFVPDAAPEGAKAPADGPDGRPPRVDELRFGKIAAGNTRYCGITEPDARLVCVQGATIVTDRAGPYVDVSMSEELGWDYICAVRASGELECSFASMTVETPTGAYTQVSVGFWDACAVTAGGEIRCWLPPELGGATPPPGAQVIAAAPPPFNGTTLSVNMWHGCAIGALFHLQCFGSGVASPHTPLHFFALAVAPKRGCGITMPEEELWCWPASNDGMDTGQRMVDGQYQSLAVNLDGDGCGVTRQGDVACWGGFDYAPPAGTLGPFRTVAISGQRACGLRTDGSVTCWPSRLR
jgi:hypothetical protein